MAKVPTVNLEDVYRGDSYSKTLTFLDGENARNLSGRTWLSQVRPSVDSDVVCCEFLVDTTEASRGIITISLSSTSTALLSPLCVWDLQSTTSGNDVETLCGGYAYVVSDVTR